MMMIEGRDDMTAHLVLPCTTTGWKSITSASQTERQDGGVDYQGGSKIDISIAIPMLRKLWAR